MYSDCNAFAFVHLKLWLIDWLIYQAFFIYYHYLLVCVCVCMNVDGLKYMFHITYFKYNSCSILAQI